MNLLGSHLDNCPPEDAEPASGIVYCLVWNNPPQEKDFIPAIERNPRIRKKGSEKEICLAHGFSVFTNIEEVLQVKKEFSVFKSAEPAVGELTSECGLIKNTPSRERYSHHTWWPPDGMEIWTLFNIET